MRYRIKRWNITFEAEYDSNNDWAVFDFRILRFHQAYQDWWLEIFTIQIWKLLFRIAYN